MKHACLLVILSAALAPICAAHPPGQDDTQFRIDKGPPTAIVTATATDTGDTTDSTRATPPAAAKPFTAFPKHVQLKWNDEFLFVESDGMPDHPMMVGITAWQQQLPIPQNYQGDNAWRIPLNPVPAAKPISAKHEFFRGAIAIAANGVPIFNPIKNDGKTDTLLAGELDEYGGHSGRADDYHYHIAPLHLLETLDEGLPIAYALDGYPIFGLLEKSCPIADSVPLDAFNGHAAANKPTTYHYHASKTYPYINGGMHGKVNVRGGQVDPQPRSTSPRPATSPLRGAKITAFEKKGDNHWALTYTHARRTYTLNWSVNDNGVMVVETIDSTGAAKKDTWQPRQDSHNPPPPPPR